MSVVLHGVTARSGSALARRLANEPHLPETFRAVVAPLSRLVVSVSGADELLATVGEGLPQGTAHAEALAIRLRRMGAQLTWGEPETVVGLGELLAFCHERGRSSLDMARADPSLVPELQLGSWFQASWRERAARELAVRLGPARGLAAPVALRVAADAAFWAGVRSAARESEWRRLTRSSYTMLVYHRLAGEQKPGQERVDTSAGRFAAQLGLLRVLAYRPLAADDLIVFHTDPEATLPRRRFVVTVDDGLRDVATPLETNVTAAPQLFVPTAELGCSAHWLDGEPVLSWEELERLTAAGVAVGSHARTHKPLTDRDPAALEDEVAGSLAELRERIRAPLPVIAYPNGRHDELVRAAVVAAGYEAAYGTEKGRNGAGTDRFCLRRVNVHAADGPVAVLWKVLTGEAVPAPFRWWRRLRGIA
jgi:peptidoglycan/xylan/chitin deacetylase (PgdA/CDA1 family)